MRINEISSTFQDGEPSFLDMVSIYADNAHALALAHLLEMEQAPGKKRLDKETREYQIKGEIFWTYDYLIPFKFCLPFIFASRGAKIGGRDFYFRPKNWGGAK